MKKFFLTLSLFAMTLMAGAQEPTLKARSVYDVNQDDKVTVQDVPALVNRLAAKAEDKTVVDTESLMDLIRTLTESIQTLKDQVSTLQYNMGIAPGTVEVKHSFVDLGLPSGTLWATCNVGAENPEDAGLYFAWGENTGLVGDVSDGILFDWKSYLLMDPKINDWMGCRKYTFEDGQTEGCWYVDGEYVGSRVGLDWVKNLRKLEAYDDGASYMWGRDWCMPTIVQLRELEQYATAEIEQLNGVYGIKLVSKKNGQSIFLPAAGHRIDGELKNAGTIGYYWSSELSSEWSDQAMYFQFKRPEYGNGTVTEYGVRNNDRRLGFSIRAVRVR